MFTGTYLAHKHISTYICISVYMCLNITVHTYTRIYVLFFSKFIVLVLVYLAGSWL